MADDDNSKVSIGAATVVVLVLVVWMGSIISGKNADLERSRGQVRLLEQDIRDAERSLVEAKQEQYDRGYEKGHHKGFMEGRRAGVRTACNGVYGGGPTTVDTWQRRAGDGVDVRAIVVAIFEDGSELRITRSMCYRS
jgi:hypothetical protein